MQALKAAFTALLTCDKDKISSSIGNLMDRLQREAARCPAAATAASPVVSPGPSPGDKEHLVLKLNQQRPGDVGVLAAFFLNHVSWGLR